jgi:hypothetical protein
MRDVSGGTSLQILRAFKLGDILDAAGVQLEIP